MSLDSKFAEIQGVLRETDQLLRELEKASKFLTQHVQTSIAAHRKQDSEQ